MSMSSATKATANELREHLQGAVRDRFAADDVFVWVEDFDPDEGWVIFERSPHDGAPTHHRIDYTAAGDGTVELTGDPVEVRRTVRFEPVAGGALLTGPIVRKDAARQLAYGAVLVPGEPDSDGEELTAEKVEEVAHAWLEQFRAIDRQHSVKAIDASPVESYLEPEDRDVTLPDGETITLPRGTWTMVAKVADGDVWGEIERGERTGFSVMGVPADQMAAAMKSVASGRSAALKRVTLADVGGGDPNGPWVAPFVSIVDRPAVPKAKFHALKARGGDSGGIAWWERLAAWMVGDQPAAKEGRRFSDATYTQLVAALEALDGLVGEAKSERKRTTKSEEDTHMDETKAKEILTGAVKSVLDEQLRPLADRIDAIEAAAGKGDGKGGGNAGPGTAGDGDSTGSGDGKTDTGAAAGGAAAVTDEQVAAIKAAVDTALAPLAEKVGHIEERTRAGSRQLDDGDGTGAAEKSTGDGRDPFGRSIA